MTELPKIFVGTMYTQEGDFQVCLQRIREQEDVTVSHFIVSGLGEKEAHNALWHAWRQAAPHNDLFVKIDADTVLVSPRTLREISDQFLAHPEITGIQAPLHDYFTDGFINGLNTFSTKVVFNDTRDELYCDRQVDTNNDVVLRERDLPLSLRPAGLHCHHADPIQAFHYGVHRMLKGQRENLSRVFASWKRDRDKIRGFALIGAHVSGRFALNRKFNYHNEEFKEAFKEASERYDELIEQVGRT
jgi:hypothetical protein